MDDRHLPVASRSHPWPDYTGGYFKMAEELPAMQAFCYAEGTAAAYQLAIRFDPEQSPFFEKSTREAMRLGLAMQYTEDDTYAFSRPYQVMGGSGTHSTRPRCGSTMCTTARAGCIST